MDNRITIKFEVDITDVMNQIIQALSTVEKDKEEQKPLSLLDAYTIEEAAKVLGVSRSYMYELAKHKDFPAMKIHGKKIIIPRRGLEEWMQKKFEEEKGSSKVIAMGGRR
ncbi:helix-turn-helix domain-containing protein [Thermoanaerobacter thermohydrosulfuricus]